MASETHGSSTPVPAASGGHGNVPAHHAPVTPGKVAMWLFLATEVMFFTGLDRVVHRPPRRQQPHGLQQPLFAGDALSR